MSIVATEVTEIPVSASTRSYYYRCQDHLGQWHRYGPVVTSDSSFDSEAHKTIAAAKVEEMLASGEVEALLR